MIWIDNLKRWLTFFRSPEGRPHAARAEAPELTPEQSRVLLDLLMRLSDDIDEKKHRVRDDAPENRACRREAGLRKLQRLGQDADKL